MQNTKISIIVPCYNQAMYLVDCMQSILNQTHTHWECIIVNDGSSDDTEARAQEWCKKDDRFTYYFKENGGLSSARNYGIQNAIGTFILPLDADDMIAPNYIALALEKFNVQPDLKLVYCKAKKFGEVNGMWQLPDFSPSLLARRNMIFCSAIYRKQDWECVNGYDENMIYGWEDWEFWVAILKDGGNVFCLDEVGFYYRTSKKSMVNQMSDEHKKYLQSFMCQKHPSFFIQHLGSPIQLSETIESITKENKNKLKSEKFVIDLFCKTFLGFTIFGLYKSKKD
ncbi:glycosyltransferase family 2 protein [Flavobacterium sp. RSB2_4_14]|uniref:glycosyltransferase family 2 protein n=1 Tax=Flavobacterium sp. RSB2_4_14 TaxID=3447665 RepID=UPI003F3183EC